MTKAIKLKKCEVCKEDLEFRMHKCKRGVAEYYGCVKCDNWCIYCKEEKAE